MTLPPHTESAYRLLHSEGVIDDLMLLFLDAMWREICDVEDQRYRTPSEALTALKARLLEAMHNPAWFTRQIFPKPPRERKHKPRPGEQMRLL